jgi:hypothetical protein
MRRLLLILIGFFIAAGSAAAVAAQEYAIKFDRAEVVGTRYHLSAKATQSTKTSFTDGTDAIKRVEDGFDMELSADVTIIEAANGGATRRSFIVLDSKLTEQDETRPLVPAGTVVIAYIRNHKTVYEANSTILDASVTRALDQVIGLHISNVGEDDLFGPTAKKRVGDRWNINVTGAERLLGELEAVAKREDISGLCVLKKVENERLYIDTTLQVANVRMSLPSGTVADGGYIKTELSARLPINQSDIGRSATQAIYMKMLGHRTNPGAADSKLEITFEGHTTFDVKVLPNSRP